MISTASVLFASDRNRKGYFAKMIVFELEKLVVVDQATQQLWL